MSQPAPGNPLHGAWAWIGLVICPLLLNFPLLAGIYHVDPLAFFGNAGVAGWHRAGLPWIDPNVGFQAQALGKLSADQWLSGTIPWWNPYNGIGLPLAAEAQPAALFLPFILLLHFPSGLLWMKVLMQVLAGLSTYALLRQLGLSRLAALTGALLFEFNGTFAWLGAPIATPVAFLPLLLLGVERLRARVLAGRHGGWLLIPVALAWSVYAGFPETAYIDGLFAAFWTMGRLASLPGRQRLALLGRLCLAGMVGLLCALPQIAPFAELVSIAYTGGHTATFAHATLPLPTLAQNLFPWLYGPIFATGVASGIASCWNNIGGYLTLLQWFVAAAGLVCCRRRLSWLLVAWIVVCMAKTYDLRPISDLVDLIPLVKSAAFYRYAPPSWELAVAMLAAIVVDGMGRRAFSSRGILVAWLATTLCAFTALWPAREILHALMDSPGRANVIRSLTWGGLSVLAAAWLVWRDGQRRRGAVVLACLLVIDACLFFALPMRSAMRAETSTGNGIAFLRAQAGLQRAYSLGPMAPNYGAYFGIAQINHNYLPVPNAWVDYVRTRLDPDADPVAFTADAGHAGPAATGSLRDQRLVAYETLGVKYVIAPAGTDPFSLPWSSSAPGDHPVRALGMQAGVPVKVSWESRTLPSNARADTASILIGNYGNTSDGSLAIDVCVQGGACAHGSQALAGSTDNEPLPIRLAPPLELARTDGTPSRIVATLRHVDSHAAVALWMLDAEPATRARMDDQPSTLLPQITLVQTRAPDGHAARLAYDGRDMAIYALDGTKPYFDTIHGACVLHPAGRLQVSVQCTRPDVLIRREAFYPGWSASIDDRPAAPARMQDIFQGVALPAGVHIVRFGYRPTHANLILAGFVLGLLALLSGLWLEWRQRRRQSAPPRSNAITMASSRPSSAG